MSKTSFGKIAVVISTIGLSFSLIVSQELPAHLSKTAVDDNSKYTTVGNIGITVSNYGTFGDGFQEQEPTDQPSCIYPIGSGIEHLFLGGLWVGANTPTGIHVTTGAFNVSRFSGGGSTNFEFTTTASENDRMVERSSLSDNKYYSESAVSHQDFVAAFTDTNTTVPSTSVTIPYHVPLGLGIHLETYAWNYPFTDAFVIFNYTITNVKDDTLKDVYVGLWADLVVRNTNITPPRVGSPFYLHAGSGYIDNEDMQMVYCYDYDGDPGYTNSYVSMAFLGADPLKSDAQYTGETFHNWWLFSGATAEEDQAPSSESERYERMSSSIKDNYYWQAIYQKPGNRMSLITTGPFAEILPDSSINVVFAVVCAKKAGSNSSTIDNDLAKENLVENVSWAYKAYYGEDSNRNGILDYASTDSTEDINGNGTLDRYVLPTPPNAPFLKVVPENSKVTLYWDDRSEKSIDLISKTRDFEGYRIYRSFLGDDISESGIAAKMGLVAEYDYIDSLFYDTGLDSIANALPDTEFVGNIDGSIDTIIYKYRYVVENLHNGWQYAFAITAFDRGDADLNLESLESSRLQNLTVVCPGTPSKIENDFEVPEFKILAENIIDFTCDSTGQQDTIYQNTEIDEYYKKIDFSIFRSELFKSGDLSITIENNLDFEIGSPLFIEILNLDTTTIYNSSTKPLVWNLNDVIRPNSKKKKTISIKNLMIPEKVLLKLSGCICGENSFPYIYGNEIKNSSFSVKIEADNFNVADKKKNEIGVYPNPYRGNALWDGSFERERKLYFYNLPADCEVRIYTLAGDLVDKFDHDSNYNGGDIQWFDNYSLQNTKFAGGEHAWDLVSRNDQAIATGLYIFTVKDNDTGKIYHGKFLVIK